MPYFGKDSSAVRRLAFAAGVFISLALAVALTIWLISDHAAKLDAFTDRFNSLLHRHPNATLITMALLVPLSFLLHWRRYKATGSRIFFARLYGYITVLLILGLLYIALWRG